MWSKSKVNGFERHENWLSKSGTTERAHRELVSVNLNELTTGKIKCTLPDKVIKAKKVDFETKIRV